jgi:tetratricopeptide (TPR) repeat protein
MMKRDETMTSAMTAWLRVGRGRQWRAALLALLTIAAALALLSSCQQRQESNVLDNAYQALVAGRHAEVLTLTEQHLRQRPDDIDALLLNSYSVQVTASDRGAPSKAIFNLDRATNLAPSRYDVWYVYGWVLYENARYEDAIKALEKAEALIMDLKAPGASDQALLASARFLIGRCCMHSNLPKGLAYLQVLRLQEPYRRWPELYNTMAILSLKQGLYSNALGWLGEGLRLDPNNVGLLRNIAVVYDIYLANPRLARVFYVRCLGALGQDSPEAAKVREQIRRRLRQLPPES